MRCSEIYQLKRQDISRQRFFKSYGRKNKSANRRVYLSDVAESVLKYRVKKFKGEYLFPQNDKDFQNPTDHLTKRHLEVVKRLGYNFRLYDCRYTFATRAIERGVDLITLASILGHSSLKMLTSYCHPSEQRKAEAIRKVFPAKSAYKQAS